MEFVDGKYLTAILYLAPASLSGHNVCTSATPECIRACLHTSGNPVFMPNKTKARIGRTKLLFSDRKLFIACLLIELAAHKRRAERQGLKPAVRLNGTSDWVWEQSAPQVFTTFPEMTFYDYTKIYNRMMPSWDMPANYHLTLSWSGENEVAVRNVLLANPAANVAVVFAGCGISAHPRPFPKMFLGRPIIDADKHDARFKDPKGSIAGLRAKGAAKDIPTGGFVIDGAAIIANEQNQQNAA